MDFLQVIQQLQTISTAPTVPNATVSATDYGELLGKLMDTDYSFASGRMPLKSLLNLLTSRVSVVEGEVVDLSANLLPSINGAVSTIQAGLSSYALASDLSSVSSSLASYALSADVSALSTSLLNYAPLADVQTISSLVAGNAGVVMDLSGHVSSLIATTGLLSLDQANTDALAVANSLVASTIQASLVLNELNDVATLGSVSSLSLVVADLSGVVAGLVSAPGFDATAITNALADLSGVRVASLESSVSMLAQNLSTTDGNVGALQSDVAGKVAQSDFNTYSTGIQGQLDGINGGLALKANISDVDYKGVRTKNVTYFYDPSAWSGDALTGGTPQVSAGLQAEAGVLVVVKTLADNNVTANAVHLSNVTPEEGVLRRFLNVGENKLYIKDSAGAVLAELIAGEGAGLCWAGGAWVLKTGF